MQTNNAYVASYVWLFVSSIRTGTRRILRLDEVSSVVRLERRTTEDSSSRRIMRLVPVFIPETNNQTYNATYALSVCTDYASSSIKTANVKLIEGGERAWWG